MPATKTAKRSTATRPHLVPRSRAAQKRFDDVQASIAAERRVKAVLPPNPPKPDTSKDYMWDCACLLGSNGASTKRGAIVAANAHAQETGHQVDVYEVTITHQLVHRSPGVPYSSAGK